MAFNSVMFFGDQTVEAGHFLQGLLRQSQTSPALQRFFGETINALRLEISSLPEDERQSLPVFHSALDLVEYRGEAGNRVVLSTLLLCLAQLGDYIRRVEQDPTLLGRPTPSQSLTPTTTTASHSASPQRRIIGFCTGLLPAAVAAVATNLSDLTSIATHIALVSFRLGLQVRNRSSLIEATSSTSSSSSSSSDSWSVAISIGGSSNPADLRTVVDRFHRTQSVPVHKHVYISSETPSSVTVSGPPSVLSDFVSTCTSSGLRCSRLPIFAAFHAPHLPSPSAESIVGSSPVLSASVPAGTALIDPSSGSPYPGKTLHDLLQDALNHIFQQELFPVRAVDGALNGLQRAASSSLAVCIFGPSNAENFLRQSLKAAGLDNAAKVQTPQVGQTADASEAIAIVGMSGRFPGSKTLYEFWDTLVQNKDLHEKVPKTRWDADLHVDPTGQKPNTAHSAYGCFLDQPGAFDNLMFNMSPRESMQTDPVQRVLLMTTYEALEMAGYRYDVKPDRSRIGTFMGLATDDWREYNISQDVDMYFVTGGLRSFASGRLNYFFKFEGPSYVVDTACSSSGAAMELACASLVSGKCDMAVAGGGSIMTGPNLWSGLSRGGFVSPTGGCKTFDETADGYCRGEGVGVVVLKRLADAIAEGDQIQGVIRGIATNHSANAPSITQPHAPTQVNLYREVLRKASLSPNQVGYVEMHGTGTQAGDVTEMTSVVSTFGSGRQPDNPLYVGGVKANVGHGEGAAGVTGLIKSLMMFRENAIPPHAGIKTRLNPKLPPLDSANIRIARRVEPFLSTEEPRRVLISSFGATGGNTCLVVEEPPKARHSSEDPRSQHVVVVSAKGQASLRGNKQRLLDFLAAHPNVPLKDIAYTSTARRPHHALRSSFCVSSVKELRQVLTSQLASTTPEPASRGNSKAQPSVVFVFPGQGFNFCGLAKTLYYTCAPFQQSLTEFDDMCKSMDLPSFIDRILDDQIKNVSNLGPVEAHLAIVAIEIALARLLKSWGLVPSAVVGHSLGEYAALCTAGVLTVADTLLLVGRRAQLVEELCTRGTHGMLVIQASADRFKSMIEGRGAGAFEIACYNGPNSIVVNGRMKNLEKIQTILQENQMAKSSYVSVPYSFHSAQLDTILEEYRQVAAGATFSRPVVPVASTLLGRMVDSEGTFSASYMADQTRKPVQFEAAIKAMQASGLVTDKTLFVETGPGAMCLSMTQATLATPCKLLPCLKSADSNWKTLSKIVSEAYNSGISVDWAEYHKQYKSGLVAVELPSYHFNLKDFWIQYKGGVAALEEEIASLKEQVATLAAAKAHLPAPSLPGLKERPEEVEIPPISTCLHRVLAEDISPSSQGGATVEFSTNLQHPKLHKLIDGHRVIGIALAPSSLYKEMALGAAQYLYERLKPGNPVLTMDLHDLVISSPMFLNLESKAPQLVKISATIKPGTTTAKVTVSSDKEHCRCTIDLETADWTRDWSRRRYLIEDRVRGLMSPPPSPDKSVVVHHLLKDMVYKIFFPITEYSSEYQSISEIFIDKSFREAAVRLDLRQTPEDSSFTFDPCWLDNIAQTAGFVLNSDVSNPDDMICMSTGCDTMRLSKNFAGGKQYLCHVRAEAVGGGDNLVCDVTVFDEEGVVALGEGLRFKRIKKVLLQRMLGLSAAGPPVAAAAGGPVRDAVTRPKAPEVVVRPPVAKQVAKMPTVSSPQVPKKTAAPRAAPAPVPTSYENVGQQQAAPIHPFANTNGSAVVKPVAKAPVTAPKPNVNNDLSAVLALISKEIGTSLDEMGDNMTLEELGVDSLLTVSITTKLKSEKNLELPASLISGSTTISELRDYFSEDGAASTGDEYVVVKDKDETEDEDEDDDDFSSTDNDLPSHGSPDLLARGTTPVSSTHDPEEPWGASKAESGSGSGSVLMEAILDAIAKETGVTPAEIGEDTPFVDLGIDSLMSVAVIGVVKDKTGEELPANLFSDCETIVEIRRMLGEEEKVANDPPPSLPPPSLMPALPPPPPMKTFNPEEYQSKAVLLQGRPRSEGPILFLVTDGGGSAAVYVQLPALAPGLTVYALDSPFTGGREGDFFLPGVTIEGVASIYARAIRSVQPHGPYMVGGYSIGGVFAYETVRYLINTGDKVHGFLVLDAACPRSLKGIIDVNVEVCQMMGLFDSISEEDQRKPLTQLQKIHVAGCVRTAGNFDPIPIPPELRPEHVYCIWARVGFVEHLSDKIIEVGHAIAERDGLDKELNPEWVEWLEAEKRSYGPRGWDKLVGNNIETFVIDGDHFSIMMRPRVKVELGPLCQKLMKRMLSTLGKSGTQQPVSRLEKRMPRPGSSPKSRLSRPVIHEAFGQAITLAPQFAKEAGCFDFLTRVYPAQRQLVLAFVTEAFEKLGCPLDKVRQGAPLEPVGVLPKYNPLLNALHEILEDGRLLEWRNGKRVRTYRPVDKTSSQTLYERLVRDDPPHANTHQLLHVTGSRLAECLTGAADPMQIVFGKSRLLLQEFYTSAPMLVTASKVVTELLRRVFSSFSGSSPNEVIEIIEVGAGLGGTAKYILDMLVEAGIPFKFTYTDISPSLTGAARQRYKNLYAQLPKGTVEYMTLDIEQQPPPSLLNRFHAVISTNCIHATKSLTASCANAHKMLRPGGFLAVVEVTPRLFWLDLVFGLLEGWWLFEDGRKHCLANETFWKTSLEAAGYKSVVYAEEGDGYKPNPQVIVACTD